MRPAGPQTLENIAVLACLDAGARRALEAQCRWTAFSAHEQIIDRASDSRDVYFVVHGLVRVVNFSYAGREVSYDDIGAGGLFGELAAIDGEPRSATVVALADTCVAALRPERFLALLRENPEIALTIMKRLVQIIRGSDDRIMALSTLGAPHRVHAELVRLAEPHVGADNSAVVQPMPLHAEIASRAGTTRETVTRVLGDLARRGIVRKEDHGLVIPDFSRLRDLVGEG